MAHGDARKGKWRGNWQMEWVASTLHTTSEYGVSSITTADAHTSAASSRLNWRPRRFKWIRPFRRKTKSGFCACAITFQLASSNGITELQCDRQTHVYPIMSRLTLKAIQSPVWAANLQNLASGHWLPPSTGLRNRPLYNVDVIGLLVAINLTDQMLRQHS
jgi:hypothetical protein